MENIKNSKKIIWIIVAVLVIVGGLIIVNLNRDGEDDATPADSSEAEPAEDQTSDGAADQTPSTGDDDQGTGDDSSDDTADPVAPADDDDATDTTDDDVPPFTGLPANWDELSLAEKIALNPYGCLDTRRISNENGQCLSGGSIYDEDDLANPVAPDPTDTSDDQQTPATLDDIKNIIADYKNRLTTLETEFTTTLDNGCGDDREAYTANFQDLVMRFGTLQQEMINNDIRGMVDALGDAVSAADEQFIMDEMDTVGTLFESVSQKVEDLADMTNTQQCGIIEP